MDPATNDTDATYGIDTSNDVNAIDAGQWLESIDPDSNQKFWYNTVTGQSTWDNPNESWIESIDPDSDLMFWFNTVTGQSTWDNPYIPIDTAVGDDNKITIDKAVNSKREIISEKSRRLREAAKQRRLNATLKKQPDDSIVTNLSDEINALKLLNEIDTFSLSQKVNDNSSILVEEVSSSLSDDKEPLSPTPPSVPLASNKYAAPQRVLTTMSTNDDIDKYLEQLLNNAPEHKDNDAAAFKAYRSSIPTFNKKSLSSNNRNDTNSSSTSDSVNKNTSPNNKSSPTSKRSSPDARNESIDIQLAPKYIPIITKANRAIIHEKRRQKEKELEEERQKSIRIARGKEYAKKVKEQLLVKKNANYDNNDDMLTHPISHSSVIKPIGNNNSSNNNNSNTINSNTVNRKDKKQIMTKPKKINTTDNNNDSIFTRPVRILKVGNDNNNNSIITSPIFGSAWIADCLAKDPYEDKLLYSYENEISKIYYEKY